jgi:hydroxymethylpyrimidine pyrophosphatase-like HAD family hydrolase/energy-coupling factor transporter ATP-binding protein EcfA2
MRYLALAADYDGTLATDGRVDAETVAGLEQLLASGRKLILVTGRQLGELLEIFPQVVLCERVVAENGALLYRPATREHKIVGQAPPAAFVHALQARQVSPLSVGHSIVATFHPHETVVLEVIRDLGLELQVIFNKGSVMVLPAGVNKATGLMAALHELGMSPHNVVGVGDAENDHALLTLCECGVAVANAVPMLKDTADLVTEKDHGAGVVQLIHELASHDLSQYENRLTRYHFLLGTRDDDKEVRISPYGNSILITGSSGSGKSTLAGGILERLSEQAYQFCIIDPEGDYESFEGAVTLGTGEHAPTVDEVLQLLEKPDVNAVVNLIGLPLHDRPAFFVGLLPRLQELRVKTGRPHWILVDETHHLLPADWEPATLTLSQKSSSMIFITVHPDQVAKSVLRDIDLVVALGENPAETLRLFGKGRGETLRPLPATALAPGEALVWDPSVGEDPFTMRITPSKLDRKRHQRKYSEGALPEDRSFYFRGPERKLNLRAQNLMLFLQIADGVDDATWLHHLHQGDYSQWFRDKIKDEGLAEAARHIERQTALSPSESRRLIKAAIEKQYTLPA